MTLAEQIYAQALVLAKDMENENKPMLEILCRGAETSLRAKLREGITPEDCKADFIAAASLYALAAMSEMDDMAQLEQFQAGDVTLRKGKTNAASCCLRYQAEVIMMPYLADSFSFRGV